jgi:putative endopeptidase
MRILKIALFVCLSPFMMFSQNSSLHGVDLGDLDRKTDPCNDFYQFANGTWRANNPIPASMTRWSKRWAAGEANKDRLKDILQEVSQQKNAPKGSPEQLIGDYYGACMDESAVNARGFDPIKPFFAEIDGINASGFSLPERDYYTKTEPRFVETREKYKQHIAKMLELTGASSSDATAAAQTVLQMETKFAEASLDTVALRDPSATDHKSTFAQLQAATPHFDWVSFFKHKQLPQDVALNIQEPKYMQEVDRQLQQTSLADWKTYLKWELLQSYATYLSAPFVNEDFAFNDKYIGGQAEIKPRWKRCVESNDRLLGEALGKKYVEKYFPPEAKARMQELVKNLLAAMKDDILSLTWMSDETKQKAMAKLATFNPKIGYPDHWKDYSSVNIRRDAFFEDAVEGRRFVVEDDRQTIGKPVDRGRWGITPPTSDAYYNPLLNEIVFPAGILQPPAFDAKAIDAVNYGAIGVVIGHEISHGFDDQGAQFAADGSLQNWWTADDLKKFKERGACVVDQYENYFIEPGIHHKGKLVLGESIGDLGGAKIAFLAYQKSLQGKPRPADIDGFTPEQQFFIAWGQFRGDAIRPEQQRLMVESDPHPIAKYRVNGPLSNLPEFRQAFSCKPDAPMIRAEGKRCEVW